MYSHLPKQLPQVPQLKLPYQTRQPLVHALHDFFLIDSCRGQSSKLVLPSPSKPIGESAQISPTANVSTPVKVCFRRNLQSSLLILISLTVIHLHLSVLRRPSTPPFVLSDGSSILIMMIFTSLHAVPYVSILPPSSTPVNHPPFTQPLAHAPPLRSALTTVRSYC